MPDSKPLYVTNPEQWLQEQATGPDLLCLILFRGAWCKYDKHYLRKLGHHHITTMKKENVRLIAWTSQGEEAAKKADQEWGLANEFGYDLVIGDETLALAKYLMEDEILPGLKIATPEEAKVQDLVPKNSYPNGIVMPGMVWYAHHGNLVFQWASRFEEPGLGGPNRPEPLDLWEHILKRKHALDHGNAIMPVHGNELKMCTNDVEIFFSNCVIL